VPDNYQSYYQEDSGLPYFSEMDSYYNYRLNSISLIMVIWGIPLKMALIGIYIPIPTEGSAEYPP
jgi:dolichyl-diphosphooligosaccharide--protein glycosyltransferase